MNTFRRFHPVVAMAGLMLGLAGCGVPASDAPEQTEVATLDAELSTTGRVLVTVQADDATDCSPPLCGGYFVTDAAQPGRSTYVSGLDFAPSGLDEDSVQQALLTPFSELLLEGQLSALMPTGTRTFAIERAYRALPGIVVPPAAALYALRFAESETCETPPCLVHGAERVNQDVSPAVSRPFSQLDLSAIAASVPLVSMPWVETRVREGRAVVQGALALGAPVDAANEIVFRARQVYFVLPERPGPCVATEPLVCGEGFVPAHSRDALRCLQSEGCVPVKDPAACAPVELTCGEGYLTVSWTAADGCAAIACDPAWSVAPLPPAENPPT